MNLKKILSNQQLRDAFLTDCVLIIECRVQSQKGLNGLAIKNAYKVMTRMTPNATRQATQLLIDDFADQLEPFLKKFTANKSKDKQLAAFLESNSDVIADSFLQVADKKAHRFKASAVFTLYKALRPHAKKHVKESIPELAHVLHKYLVTPTGIEPVFPT